MPQFEYSLSKATTIFDELRKGTRPSRPSLWQPLRPFLPIVAAREVKGLEATTNVRPSGCQYIV